MEIHWDRLDAAAWGAVLPPDAAALQHAWRYGAAVAALGQRVHRAEIWDGGRCLGLAQVLVRRSGPIQIGLLPRGPVWLELPASAPRILQALRRGLLGAPVSALIATPETPAGGIPILTPQTLAELPLNRDADVMRAAMHQKWRNALKKAERSKVKIAVTRPNPDDLAWLVRLDADQGRQRGYRGLSAGFLAAWAADDGSQLRLFTARAGGDVIAAMLFLDHAPGATYHLGWTGAEGRATSAHRLLLWRAMQHFAKAGRMRLDLGPLDTVNAPGLARFKLGAGAQARALSATALHLPGPGLLPRRAPRRRGAQQVYSTGVTLRR